MGNILGGGDGRRRNENRRGNPPPPPPPPPHPEISANQYVVATAAPYGSQYQNPNPPPPFQYPGYYPPPPPVPPVPLPAPYVHRGAAPPHMGHTHVNRVSSPYGPVSPPPTVAYVEQQKAVTIRNDVNIKKETLRMEPDLENPGQLLVALTFDAIISGSLTIMLFAKEGEGCDLVPMKGSLCKPVTVHFDGGLGQKLRQPPGTGFDASMLNEGAGEVRKDGGVDVYPLVVKAEAASGLDRDSGSMHCQITQAVFEKKDKGDYQVKVMKQILWANGMKYELQEIYGIGNSVDSEYDGSNLGKECVICLSEPCDITVLPCRHMCLCKECAKILRLQTNRCPICRHSTERLLEITVGNDVPND